MSSAPSPVAYSSASNASSDTESRALIFMACRSACAKRILKSYTGCSPFMSAMPLRDMRKGPPSLYAVPEKLRLFMCPDILRES